MIKLLYRFQRRIKAGTDGAEAPEPPDFGALKVPPMFSQTILLAHIIIIRRFLVLWDLWGPS